MVGCYDVMLRERCVGQVKVSKEGLYYKFKCSVKLHEGNRYHLIAYSQSDRMDLGLCVPQKNYFEVSTRIPMKRFACDRYDFVLDDAAEKVLIKINNDEPFSYVQDLSNSRFLSKNGEVYIEINRKRKETV